MACETSYATTQEYIDLWCIDDAPTEMRRRITSVLKMASGPINLARASVNGCDCTPSAAGEQALSFLSCVMAAVMYDCPCGSAGMDDSMKQTYLAQVINPMLGEIRDQTLELCEGETGSTWPALGYAAVGWTGYNRASIYLDQFRRLMS